jgi:hypothetical protein
MLPKCTISTFLSGHVPRTTKDDIHVTKMYHTHIPPTRETLEELEANTCQIKQNTPDNEIEALAWIQDTGLTRSRETMYFRTIDGI